jgi:threonine 3-dehydrogenase
MGRKYIDMTDSTIPDTMRVPHFEGGGRIAWAEKPVPKPGPGQLLLKVRANALCASERHAFEHGSPVVPGHEAAGVVAAAGPETGTPSGTPGVVFLMDFCGTCRSCRIGATNQCLAKRADYGFSHDGGYAPYELVNENVFFAIDSDLDLADATMLLDVMGTGGHAIDRARLVHPDPQSLLVTGAGPIGLGILAMAKILFGPDFPVLISDMIPFRLELAEQLGGLTVDLAKESLAHGLKRHGFEEIDLAIDASGKETARRGALDLLAKRGVLVCPGHGEGLALDVSPDLIAPERAVLGSEYFPFSDLTENLRRFREHHSYLASIVTHRFALDDIERAFGTFFEGNTGKVVIEQ